MKEPAHLALHPFGQIPTYEDDDLVLFETGAIVFHIAEHHAGLMPEDANARARAITWMFAALNTVEPAILEFANAKLLEGDRHWYRERLPVEGQLRSRLNPLSARLGHADWLDGAFSAGDLMMVSVLLRLRSSGMLNESANLVAYVARGEARPAYRRAFAAQLAVTSVDQGLSKPKSSSRGVLVGQIRGGLYRPPPASEFQSSRRRSLNSSTIQLHQFDLATRRGVRRKKRSFYQKSCMMTPSRLDDRDVARDRHDT